MRRDQLEHAIRTACQIIGAEEVIVVGSQAILGSLTEDRLPAAATMSLEVDILPIAADEADTLPHWPTRSRAWPASGLPSRRCTASASTGSAW